MKPWTSEEALNKIETALQKSSEEYDYTPTNLDWDALAFLRERLASTVKSTGSMDPKTYLEGALRTEPKSYSEAFVRLNVEWAGYHVERVTPIRLLHAAIGMCSEVGEFQDSIKQHVFYGKPLDIHNLVEEIGDILWYQCVALSALGSNFEEAFQKNHDKLKARYPERFTEEAALNQDLEAERRVLEGVGQKNGK